MKRWLYVLCVMLAGTLAGCGGSTSAGRQVQVKLVDYMIMPMHISIAAGQTTFEVRNDGATPHNFTVRSANGSTVGATPNLNHGQTAKLTLDLSSPKYQTLCTEPGHASLGMVGSITVTSKS